MRKIIQHFLKFSPFRRNEVDDALETLFSWALNTEGFATREPTEIIGEFKSEMMINLRRMNPAKNAIQKEPSEAMNAKCSGPRCSW